jgi:hypothetical protein
LPHSSSAAGTLRGCPLGASMRATPFCPPWRLPHARPVKIPRLACRMKHACSGIFSPQIQQGQALVSVVEGDVCGEERKGMIETGVYLGTAAVGRCRG